MFQGFKRAAFLSNQNFPHWDTGDGVKMHLWLQKNGWPANEFVDLFMRAMPNTPPQSFHFKDYLTSQYDWASRQDTASLLRLWERVASPEFRNHDSKNLRTWMEPMVKAKS
jgi:hypothetical protein